MASITPHYRLLPPLDAGASGPAGAVLEPVSTPRPSSSPYKFTCVRGSAFHAALLGCRHRDAIESLAELYEARAEAARAAEYRAILVQSPTSESRSGKSEFTSVKEEEDNPPERSQES